MVYAFKGLLSSVANDDDEGIWLRRVNKWLERFSVENLYQSISTMTFTPVFRFYSSKTNFQELNFREILDYWVDPVFSEVYRRNNLLGPKLGVKLNRLNENLGKFDCFKGYLNNTVSIYNWDQYLASRPTYKDIIRPALDKFKTTQTTQDLNELKNVAEDIERKMFAKTIGGIKIEFNRLYR